MRCAIIIEETGEEQAVKVRTITDYYLLNPAEDGTERYKLLLTQNDRETLRSLLDRSPTPASASRRLLENHAFFVERIGQPDLDLATVYNGIRKLMVVDVALDPHADNPQLIFESLNSTGLALTQADLIRNYVLMGLPPSEQEALYADYWLKMEQSFGQPHYASHFDAFMRHYLTLKLGRIPRISDVYTEFKAFAQQSGMNVAELVADVHRYSRHYVQIALGRGSDPELRARLDNINEQKVDTAYPLLLVVLDDYERGVATRDEVLGLLRLIDSYVLRRAICGIPTNTLNRTFLGFSRGIDKANYLESATAAFQLLDSYRRFPSDEEFRRDFVSRDIYNLTARRNYILRRLENHDRKEVVNVESFTIEHVMPQNERLSAAWRTSLGSDWKRVQEAFLHTIGNLTLTGYNSELSDRPFPDKRDMDGGFRDSPIRLNKDLASLDTWNETAIKDRAARLADLAARVWPGPRLPETTLMPYRQATTAKGVPTYTVADHSLLKGHVLALFEALRTRILNLDSSVVERILKSYIVYRISTNFVDVIPREDRLKLVFNMDYSDIDDPDGLCFEHDSTRYTGNGGVAMHISALDQIDYALFLVRQSFLAHTDDIEG